MTLNLFLRSPQFTTITEHLGEDDEEEDDDEEADDADEQ